MCCKWLRHYRLLNFQPEFSAQIFSTNFQRGFQRGTDSQCTNFNSNNLRVVSPLVYNIYSVIPAQFERGMNVFEKDLRHRRGLPRERAIPVSLSRSELKILFNCSPSRRPVLFCKDLLHKLEAFTSSEQLSLINSTFKRVNKISGLGKENRSAFPTPRHAQLSRQTCRCSKWTCY